MTNRDGVDVASFQGQPRDWQSAAGNIGWAAVKFTELQPDGNAYVNPDAAADWAYLKRRGKARVAYLFGHPATSVTETAGHFVATARALGLENGDGICLDHEVTDGRSPAEVSAWARQVLDLLRGSTGRKPLVYTFLNFAETGNCEGLGGHPLWIADPSSKPGHPRVPAPWKTWAVHQYQSSGDIDRDIISYPDTRRMTDALGKRKPEPKEPSVQDLGGNLSGRALASARWPGGVIVVAGADDAGHIWVNRHASKKWSGWKDVAPGPAKSAPSILAWRFHGSLFYTAESGHVHELTTTDHGLTWA